MVGSVNVPARLVACNYGCILRKALATKYSFVESTLNDCVRSNWERSGPTTVPQRDTLAIERKTSELVFKMRQVYALWALHRL